MPASAATPLFYLLCACAQLNERAAQCFQGVAYVVGVLLSNRIGLCFDGAVGCFPGALSLADEGRLFGARELLGTENNTGARARECKYARERCNFYIWQASVCRCAAEARARKHARACDGLGHR